MARVAAVTSFLLLFRRHPLTADCEVLLSYVSLGATLGCLRVAVSKPQSVIAGTSTRGRSQMQVR
jgi:hypothetical protein